MSGEELLRVVRRAVEATGVSVTADDVLARRRLELAVEAEARSLDRGTCGSFEWDDD